MANVLTFHHLIVFFGRSISLNSKLLKRKSSPKAFCLPTYIWVNHFHHTTKMTSSTTTTSMMVIDEQDKVVIGERPSIIKSVVSTTLADTVKISPTIINRPSVICTIQKSVINTVPVPTPVIKGAVIDMKKPSLLLSSAEIPPDPKDAEETTIAAESADSEATDVEKIKRIKKRKVVLMLSYSGTGYYGMQKNPGTKTIEDELFQSLLKNNYIDQEMYDRPQLMNFQRAARTDKNVSAARQIVSLKLPENASVELINQHLPEQILIQGMKRVTKGFDAKNNCDARTYSYMTPTFVFVPLEGLVTEAYRINPEQILEVRELLKSYIGCKNYHNFTSRKKPGDPSAQRIILSFTCSEPFIQDGLEYVIMRVKGQSFMMHQIRKMIGLIIAIIRGFASHDVMDTAFTLKRIDIPRAPGLGLLLDKVHYERYDKKYSADGMHESLTWDTLDSDIDEFCKKYIYSTVTKLENEEKSMFTWLGTLPYHTYGVREHEPLVAAEDKDKRTKEDNNGEPSSQSGIGKAFMAVVKSGERQSVLAGIDNDDEDEGGADDDDNEIPKLKKFKQGA